MKELDKQQAEEIHNKLREIISSYEGNQEYGDCIIDEICFLFGHATTTDVEIEEEKDIPVLFYTIKNKIGWSRWCDVVGGNHYAIAEGFRIGNNEIFYCTKSQADELGL